MDLNTNRIDSQRLMGRWKNELDAAQHTFLDTLILALRIDYSWKI